MNGAWPMAIQSASAQASSLEGRKWKGEAMAYQAKTWKDKRSQQEIKEDKMYRHYLDEKDLYQETDILSKKEYLEKYKEFLIEKLKEENPHDS